MIHGADPATWFARGVYPTCLCGYDPKDNAALNNHWATHGFEVVDDHGFLTHRPIAEGGV